MCFSGEKLENQKKNNLIRTFLGSKVLHIHKACCAVLQIIALFPYFAIHCQPSAMVYPVCYIAELKLFIKWKSRRRRKPAIWQYSFCLLNWNLWETHDLKRAHQMMFGTVVLQCSKILIFNLAVF